MSSSPVSPPQVALVNCTAWQFLELDSDVTGIGVSSLFPIPARQASAEFIMYVSAPLLTKD